MNITIDKNLKLFVGKYVDSLASWAIIVFYHQNPGVRDRITDLATHLGRRESDIEIAVIELTKKGLLLKEDEGEEAVYTYDPESILHQQVEEFVNALDVRDVRLWVLSEVLEK
ncbi:MAG: hypothetical protein Q8J63_09720 [Candidatus Aquicultor sp.]|nr:hypothetical protein [Candidatus Aquicultor sp.]